MIPCPHIINTIDSFPFSKYCNRLIFLLFCHHGGPHKRWIPHDVIQFLLGHHALPVHLQGVTLHNIGVGFQGQEVQGHVHDVLGLLHHLALRDPQGRLGHGHGKVIDLNAVELADGDLDRIGEVPQSDLVGKGAQGFIFQLAQGDVGLGQEVAGAAGGVQDFSPASLL